MPTRGHRELEAPEYSASAAVDDGDSERDGPRSEGGSERGFNGPGAPHGSGRRRKRRHRSQKGRPPRRPRSPDGGPHIDVVNRERMFQDIEGLLRQIRERAEEASVWTEDQLNDFTQAVTGFTKSLEQESEQISQRVRDEYQRIREKLSHALRG